MLRGMRLWFAIASLAACHRPPATSVPTPATETCDDVLGGRNDLLGADPLTVPAGSRLDHELPLNRGWTRTETGDVGPMTIPMPWGTMQAIPVTEPTSSAGVVFVRERSGVRCLLGSWSYAFGGNGVVLQAIYVEPAGAEARTIRIEATAYYHHYYGACDVEDPPSDNVEDCHAGMHYVGGHQAISAELRLDRRRVTVVRTDDGSGD